MPLVVDASVGAKWYIPEVQAAIALGLLRSEYHLLAPAHLIPELANAIWKQARKQSISDADAQEMVADLALLPVTLEPIQPLLGRAMEIAVQYDRTVYDALYVALALRENCQVVTADLRLYNALRTAFPKTLLWIGDLPPTV